MEDKIYILVIHVDLSCCHCREKLQKYLWKIQSSERIFGTDIDEKKSTVSISGPFCNPHQLSEKLKRDLPRVIKSIDIRDPQKEKEEKEKKEKEEKEKKEKEEKEKKEKEDKEKKEIEDQKCKREQCLKDKFCRCNEKPPVFVVKGKQIQWPPSNTDWCHTPASDPCRPGPCGPCSCNRSNGWNDCRCSCSSCGTGAGQGGYYYGPTPAQPLDMDYKTIVFEDYPAPNCSIM